MISFRRLLSFSVALALGATLASASDAQQRRSDYRARSERFDASGVSVALGLGLTTDPSAFLLGISVPVTVAESFSLGPHFQVGIDDDFTYFALSFNGRYQPRGPRLGDFELLPFVEGGPGFARISIDRRGNDFDDTAFLIDLGAGVETFVTENVALGTRMDFDLIPGGLPRDELTWTWQILTARLFF